MSSVNRWRLGRHFFRSVFSSGRAISARWIAMWGVWLLPFSALIAIVPNTGRAQDPMASRGNGSPLEVPCDKRSPLDWVEQLLRLSDENQVSWESISVCLPLARPKGSKVASVEVFSPDRFSKLSHLIGHRIGAATMNDVSPVTGPKRRQVVFDVALDPRSVEKECSDAIETPRDAFSKLFKVLSSNSEVRVRQVLLTGCETIKKNGRSLLGVSLQLTLSGGQTPMLTLVSKVRQAYPYFHPQTIKISSFGNDRTVHVAGPVIVRDFPSASGSASDDQGTPQNPLADLQNGSRLKVSAATRLADSLRFDVTGTVSSLEEATSVIERILSAKGLARFVQLGLQADGPGFGIVGMTNFRMGR